MKVSSPMVRLFAVAIVAATMTVATAYAQQGGGRGGRGGAGGGFGGRGGGGGGQMGGDPTFGLLRSDEVIAELKISDEQKTALGKLAEQMRPTRPEGVDFGTMSEEERTKFFEKMRTESEAKMAEMKGQLDEVLLPDQTDRLKQIVLQVRGSQALEDAEIAKELSITEDQKKELTKVRDSLREEMQTKMREMFSNRDQNTNMQEEMGKMRTDMETKMLAVLTADQRAQFEKMKGVKFDMPERATGFGGRGGPGGGPGGAQGGAPGGGRGGRGGGRPQRPGSAE